MQSEETEMKDELQYSGASTSSILPVATAALTIGIFVLDTLTDLEIAAAVFYVAVVLISVRFFQKRGVVLVAAACMALTILSFLLTRGSLSASGLINCVISLSAIGASTYLVLQIRSMEMSIQEARAQLAHVARVTTLGELTASIAHEVNQPLTGVVSNGNACLRWLAYQPPNLEKARQAVDRIVKDANRASEVVGRVRSLAKRALPHKDWLNINEAVREIVVLTRREVEQNQISLRTQLADDLPLVWGDRIQLQQVLLNLIINAIQAMSVLGDGQRDLLISSAKDESGGALLTVRDSGSGLDSGKLEEIFEAFYTTKARRHGHGTGGQSFDHRGPRRASMGDAERASRRGLSIHTADGSGGELTPKH